MIDQIFFFNSFVARIPPNLTMNNTKFLLSLDKKDNADLCANWIWNIGIEAPEVLVIKGAFQKHLWTLKSKIS